MRVFSSKFIERYLQEHPWRALSHQGHSGNLKIGPKFQIEVYQELCERLGRPPTSDEFWDEYYELNRTDIENLSLEEKGGLQKRVHDKAWAAFICQDHFLGLLAESGEFDSIYTSTVQDTEQGIDFKIAKNDAVYGIKIHFSFTESTDGYWITIKDRRKRDVQLNIKIIDILLKPDKAKSVGNVCLYTPQHIRELLELVEAQEINAEGKGKPAAPPEATATTAPLKASSELEQLRLNWKQVIAQAPEDTKRTPAIAILRSAGVKPLAFEDDTAVLAFRYSYHMEKIEEPENQRITEKIISNFLRRPCHVRCIYQPEDNHLVREAQKMGAQIIDTEEK